MTPPDQEQRRRAIDHRHSVIVQAPAGSGKTSLLVARYLRLLSMADQPEEILAITFTRKAAGEMRERVIHALTVADEAALGALERSRALNWNLAQQPNRLRIQTIDSFAMTLLRQMPLTGSFNPQAELIENAEDLYLQAADRLFNRLYDDDPLAEFVADFLAWMGNDHARGSQLLAAMLGRRDQWLDVVGEVVRTHQQAPERVPAVLGTGIEILNARLIAELRTQLGESCYEELEQVVDQAARHLHLSFADSRERYCFTGATFTTKQDRLRRSLTRREGFPPSDPELKQRGLDLIGELADRGGEPLLSNLRYLPAAPSQGEDPHTLLTLCVTLTLATLELNGIFAARQVADFTQLILGARALLNDGDAPTELALALDYRIRHLLIDEFQDTSISQFRMFEQLVAGWGADDGNTFFAVGDPMQSIYRFRDAEVSLFFDAWDQGIGGVPLERVRLSANFRAQGGLVDWFNRAFAEVLGTTQDPLLGRVAFSPAVAVRDAGDQPAVTLSMHQRDGEEIQAIIDTVQRLHGSDPATRVAILVRGRGHLQELLPALRTAGIGWRATDIEPLLERPAVQDLLSLARALADPDDRLAWFSVLRSPWVGLSLKDLEAFAGVPRLRGVIARPPAAVSADGQRRLQRLAAALALGDRLADEAPPRRTLESVWIAAGGVDAYPDAVEIDNAERLLELVDSLGNDGLDPQQLTRAAGGLYARGNDDARLEILTIHKAKGLEFDHVILPFLHRLTRTDDPPLLRWRLQPPGLLMAARDSGSLYAWLAREDRARERHELERLVYVACTRAREGLHLFSQTQDRARSGSLLDMFGSTLQGLQPGPQAAGGPHNPSPVQNDLFAGRAILRLETDYEWRAPRRRALKTVVRAPVEGAVGQLERRWQVALGTQMHETLWALSQAPLPHDAERFIAARQGLWQSRLLELRVDADDHRGILAELARQVRLVLEDPVGRWLLGSRRDAASEAPLTGSENGELVNVFLDRTFIDDEGVRWVIDYKSVVPDPGLDPDFIARETARYRPQLRRYAELAAGAYDEPLRTAIYYTALPRLEVVETVG